MSKSLELPDHLTIVYRDASRSRYIEHKIWAWVVERENLNAIRGVGEADDYEDARALAIERYWLDNPTETGDETKLRWLVEFKVENLNGIVISVLARGRWYMWTSAHPFKVMRWQDEERQS